MKALVLALTLLAATACGHLNQINTGLMVAANATIVADWHQTDYVPDHQAEGYYENNPMLGPNPSHGAIALYMSSWIVGLTAAHYVLPKWAQPIFYGAVIGIELSTIRGNLEQQGGWK